MTYSYFQVLIAVIAAGLCTRWFGWAGFAGAIVGQILFMVLDANGVL